jgi:hypothetical protein
MPHVVGDVSRIYQNGVHNSATERSIPKVIFKIGCLIWFTVFGKVGLFFEYFSHSVLFYHKHLLISLFKVVAENNSYHAKGQYGKENNATDALVIASFFFLHIALEG